LQRLDKNIDAIWKDTTPLIQQWGSSFSIRWTGFLVPPTSGTYRVGVNGFSEYKLFIDDELIVSFEHVHHPGIKSKEIELEGGRFYKLVLDYVGQGLDPQVQLLWVVPDTDYLAPALKAAEKVDVIIAVMGLTANLEGEEMPVEIEGFSGGDRTDIKLPQPQEDLLQQLSAFDKPVVLVLLSGSALAVSWAAEHIPAIVQAWYPGEAGGDALADVLFGDHNPGGRLPVTFYRSAADLPPFEDYQMVDRTYRYFPGEPLFPFGHGLSYTKFQFDNLQIDQADIQAGGQVRISAEITNSGDCAGDEVVQLYARRTGADQFGAAPRPIKELKGFKRISLQPGERRTVTFTLFANQLSTYDEELISAVQPGKVEVMIGSSSANLPLKGTFEITGVKTCVHDTKVFFSQTQVE
jgi:beta-glucosidase